MKQLEACTIMIFEARYGGSVGAFLVPCSHTHLIEPIYNKLTGGDSENAWIENIFSESKYPLVYGETVDECISKIKTEYPDGVYGKFDSERHDFMCDFIPELEKVLTDGLDFQNGKALLLKFSLNPYQF